MRTSFRQSFVKDVRKLKDASIRQRVAAIIEEVERAGSLAEIEGLKKLSGASGCYRVRIGDYRIGLMVDEDTVRFVRCLHRRDIYRHFP